MSEFTYLFRGRKTSGSPEEMQKHFEKWVAWSKELNAAGRLKDPGRPLEGTGKVVSGSQRVVKDGPYAEAKGRKRPKQELSHMRKLLGHTIPRIDSWQKRINSAKFASVGPEVGFLGSR
jgi:hypothetical protein